MRGRLAVLALALSICGAAQAADHTPVVTPPKWLKIPTAEDLARFWPANAGMAGGAAKIRCIVTTRGLLDQCAVVSEDPPGHGFGGAALLLAPLFQMQPQNIDGVAQGGGVVIVPIRFTNPSGLAVAGEHVRVANNLAWAQVPSAAALAAAFPTQTAGDAAFARVVLRCKVSAEFGLKTCETATEEPRGRGFAKAAMGLSKSFRAYDDPALTDTLHDLYVDVPFDFRDPRKPSPPVEIHDPQWLQTANAEMAGRLFPVDAAKAGLKTGRAVVDCQAGPDGALGPCTVVSEDPANLGFGAAALEIAAVMKMNPWTAQGDPVDGVHIRLPIRVNMAAEASPAPGK